MKINRLTECEPVSYLRKRRGWKIHANLRIVEALLIKLCYNIPIVHDRRYDHVKDIDCGRRP